MNSSTTWLMRLTFALIGVFAFLQVYSVQAILPILQQDFLANETQLGLTVGATVVGIAMISPFMGMLSDRFGRKNIIIFSMIALAVPTFLMSFAPSLNMMIGLRFLQGLAVPGITVVTIAYIGEELSGKEISQAMSMYVSGTVLGGFLGRFILGHLQEIIGWRHAFIVMGIATLCGTIWVAWQLPPSQHFIANQNLKSSLQLFSQHLRNRNIIMPALLGMCVLFSLVGCFTYINLHLADTPYHLSSADLANIFAIYLIGMVITPIVSPLIGRFGSKKVIISAILMSICGIILSFLSPLFAIIFALTLMSTGVFITQSATISYIAMNIQQGRSLASGIYYSGYYCGGFIGAWCCAIAYQYGQWTATVLTLVLVQILALLVAYFGLKQSSSQ